MRPLPGDMVQIVLNAWESLPDFLLVATKGSIARAMSFQEYCDYFNIKSEDLAKHHYISQGMAQGKQFPFIFVKVAPPSQEILSSFHVNDCQVGKVVILDWSFFQIIDKDTIENAG